MKALFILLIVLGSHCIGQNSSTLDGVKALYISAVEDFQTGDRSASQIKITEVIALDSTFFEAWYLNAILAFEAGDYVETKRRIARAATIRPFDAELTALSGKTDFFTSDFQRAEASLKRAISIGDTNQITYLFLSLALAEQQNFQEALYYFDLLISKNSQNGLYWFNRGMVYTRMELPEKALIDFQQALTLMPEDVPTLLEISKTSIELNQKVEALNYLENALDFAEGEERIQLLLLEGNLYRERADYKNASNSYDLALEIDSLNPVILTYQSALMIDLEDYNRVITLCNSALTIDPNLEEAYLNRGIAYEMIRNTTAACEDWQKAFILGSERAVEYLNSAVCNE